MQSEIQAADYLHGAVSLDAGRRGWVRPQRFAASQLRTLGSVRAWHPGLYKQMAACTAGVRLELTTDATMVELELAADPLPRGSASVLGDVAACKNAPEPPYDGVACVVDGETVALEALPDAGGELDLLFDLGVDEPAPGGLMRLPGMGEAHTVELWLPALRGCVVKALRCDGSFADPVAEKPRLLVVGDSIAQGFVSCDPSGSWPALLAKKLGLDLLNQGIGGQVFMPGAIMGLAAALGAEGTPAAVVVELGCNYRFEACGLGRASLDARVVLDEIAEAWPQTPVYVLGCLPVTEDVYPTHPRSCFAEMDEAIRVAAARHAQMVFVDASALYGERGLADGSDHPGPAGHASAAKKLAAAMR